MWSIKNNRPEDLKQRVCAALFMGIGLTLAMPALSHAQNLKHPPALEIFARPDAVTAPALSPDASHTYLIERKLKTVSLIDHDLVAKSKIEIVLTGTTQATVSITPLDSRHLLLSYPATNGKLAGSIVNLGTRKIAALSYNAQTITYDRVTVFQGNMGPVLSVTGRAGNEPSVRFDYDPVMDKMSRTPLEAGVRDQWLNAMGEAQFAETVSNDGQTWGLRVNAAGTWREVMQAAPATYAPKILGPGRDADSLYLRTPEGELKQISIDGVVSPVETMGKVAAPVYSRTGATALGLAFHGDWTEYQFDAPEARLMPSLAARTFEKYRIAFVDFASDPRRCLIKTEGEDDAGTYYFVDFANDEFVELGKTRPSLREEWISEKEAFTYKASDGTDLKAFLTLPPGREPHGLPLVALLNDTPQGLGFDPVVSSFATRGYAVLQTNARKDKPSDLADAIAYLKANGVIDDARVCMVGKGLKTGDSHCAIDSSPLYEASALPDGHLKPLKAVVDNLLKDNAPY